MFFDQDAPLVADEINMLDLAPVSLWLEDASRVKTLFEGWTAAGMTSLRDWLGRPDKLAACLSELKILKVNRKTLDLFEAADFPQFLANLPKIITAQSLKCLIDQWVMLWEGQTAFHGKTVNTTATGRVLDVQIRGNILPGYEQSWGRILVTIEDVTDLEAARRAAAASEAYARGLFEHSPVALWVKDFSGVKRLLDSVRDEEGGDLAAYFEARPDFTRRCLAAVEVIDVNRQAVRLFGANEKGVLLNADTDGNGRIGSEDMTEEILGLWNGLLFQQRDALSKTLDGRDIHVQIQASVLPGHESDWAKVQIARIDISDRKKAEAHLRYVGSHDLLTQLGNRRFFAERLGELEASALHPVTVIVIDVNGLKQINDTAGHAAGDAVIGRLGKILRSLVQPPFYAARIGGDEFAVVMPQAGGTDGQAAVQALDSLVALDNQIASDAVLSISVGAATSQRDERLAAVVRRADQAMYRSKAAFYAAQAGTDSDRRGRGSALNR